MLGCYEQGGGDRFRRGGSPVEAEERANTLEFRILGPLDVLRDGHAVPVGGPRPRAVLARLLLDPGRVVPAGTLVEDVWNGRPPPTAAKTLQKYVSELRRALGDDAVRTAGAGYALAPECDVDAHRFERLVARAQRARPPAEAERLAGEALGLWRGDVLADLPEARFADGERTRLGELRLIAVETFFGAQVASGRHDVAAAGLAEVVDAHPLREALWALLVQALYASGRQAEALRAFERHRRFLAEELGLEPSPELRRLEASILRHELDVGVVASPGNLPHPVSSFVGRGADVESLTGELGRHRLVTLTGPGGVGKTRLALELARGAANQYPGGAWFVDLAAARDEAGVVAAVAGSLGIDEQPGQALLDTVTAVLAHRPPVLIVLDNCEQVAEASGALATTLLFRCQPVRLLATSRAPLGVDGECIRVVSPLEEGEAVALFENRAALAAGGFALTPDDGPVVADICRRLDGLPLAIELAAGQLRVLDPAQLAARLDDTTRHRTLLRTVERSYELLTPAAQDLFDRLGAFPGSFPLEAAEAMGGPLAELVDHSLVMREAGRFRLLDTLRLYARARLDAAGRVDEAMGAVAAFVLELVRTGAAHFAGPDEEAWRRRLQAEDHTMRAVLAWAAAREPATAHRLAVALWPSWDVRWQEEYATSFLGPLLAAQHPLVPEELRAWALTVAADLGANQGDGRAALAWADEALATFGRLGARLGLASARLARGAALGNRGDLDEAARELGEALLAARELGDHRLHGRALQILGVVAVRRGERDAAIAYHGEELRLAETAGSIRARTAALRRLAAIERDRGDVEGSERLCRDALMLMQQVEDSAGIAHVHLVLADLARLRDDRPGAAALYDRALDELRAIGDRRCMASTFKTLGDMARAAGDGVSAALLFRDALRLREELGDVPGQAECRRALAALGQLDVAAER